MNSIAIWFLQSEFLVCLMIYLQTEIRYFSLLLLFFSGTILFVNQKGPRLYVQLQKQSIFFLSSVSFHSFIQFQSDFHMSGSGIQKPTWQTFWKLTWAIRKLKLVKCTIKSTKLGWISSLDLSYRVSAWWHSMFSYSERYWILFV